MIMKNSDFEATISLFNDDNSVMDISDLNAKLIVREKNRNESAPLIDKGCEVVDNEIKIFIKHDETKDIERRDGYYNIVLFNNNDDVKYRIAEGKIDFTESLDNDS